MKCIRKNIHMYAHAHLCILIMYGRSCIHSKMYTYACMLVCLCVFLDLHVHIHAHEYMHTPRTYVVDEVSRPICIHTHAHTHTRTHAHTLSHAHRHNYTYHVAWRPSVQICFETHCTHVPHRPTYSGTTHPPHPAPAQIQDATQRLNFQYLRRITRNVCVFVCVCARACVKVRTKM
jgi:hypothetical protein